MHFSSFIKKKKIRINLTLFFLKQKRYTIKYLTPTTDFGALDAPSFISTLFVLESAHNPYAI